MGRQVLGQEVAVERRRQPDHAPDEDDQGSAEGEFPGREQRANVLEPSWAELRQRPFHRRLFVDGGDSVTLCKIPLDLHQVFHGQGLRRAVVLGHIVQDFDRFLVSSLAYQVPWAFPQLEQEKAGEECGERDRAHRVHEIPPAHVVSLLALSSGSISTARIARQESPSGPGWNHLPKRPPHR